MRAASRSAYRAVHIVQCIWCSAYGAVHETAESGAQVCVALRSNNPTTSTKRVDSSLNASAAAAICSTNAAFCRVPSPIPPIDARRSWASVFCESLQRSESKPRPPRATRQRRMARCRCAARWATYTCHSCRNRSICSAPSYCDYSVAERPRAFGDFIIWVEAGVKPAGDNVMTLAILAQLNYGCTSTDNMPGSDKSATAKALRAQRKLPACS